MRKALWWMCVVSLVSGLALGLSSCGKKKDEGPATPPSAKGGEAAGTKGETGGVEANVLQKGAK